MCIYMEAWISRITGQHAGGRHPDCLCMPNALGALMGSLQAYPRALRAKVFYSGNCRALALRPKGPMHLGSLMGPCTGPIMDLRP